jgi:hypothetical protein
MKKFKAKNLALPKIYFLVLLFSFLFLFSQASDVYSEELKTVLQFENSIRVTLVEKKFNPEQAKIERCQNDMVICLINGGIPFGTAGSMPKTYLDKLNLEIGDKSYDLETSNMYNAWGEKPKEISGVIKYMAVHCYSPKTCTLRGIFSDAAGSFVAEWIISNGIPLRTILSNSKDIVNLFIKKISPPVFN